MTTNIFISWSGDLSRKLAKAIRDWLPSVLQEVTLFFSPDDLDKGVMWDYGISKKLAESQLCLLCLTRDNTKEPWILFEAGAVSMKLEESRVCPILFGLKPEELQGPLSNFQTTIFEKDDFKKLVTTIYRLGKGINLQPKVLAEMFEKEWPILEENISSILASYEAEPKKDSPTVRDLFTELQRITRILAEPPKPLESESQFPQRLEGSTAFSPAYVSRISESLRESAIARNDAAASVDSSSACASDINEFSGEPQQPAKDTKG